MPGLSLLTQILITLGLVAVSGLTGFIGGCQHEKDSQAQERLEATKNAARLEKQDATSGVSAVAKIRQKENEISANLAKVQEEATRKSLIIVRNSSTNCPVQILNAKDSQPAEKDQVNEPPSVPTVLITADFKRLYDLSFYPEHAGIRAGTYETTRETSIVQGFNEFIAPNNSACSRTALRLEALQDRIRSKQKLYAETLKEGK